MTIKMVKKRINVVVYVEYSRISMDNVEVVFFEDIYPVKVSIDSTIF